MFETRTALPGWDEMRSEGAQADCVSVSTMRPLIPDQFTTGHTYKVANHNERRPSSVSGIFGTGNALFA